MVHQKIKEECLKHGLRIWTSGLKLSHTGCPHPFC